MTIVLLNSAKIKPRHILAVPLVTSPGTIRSKAKLKKKKNKIGFFRNFRAAGQPASWISNRDDFSYF